MKLIAVLFYLGMVLFFASTTQAGDQSTIEKVIYDHVLLQCSSDEPVLIQATSFADSMKYSFKAFNDTIFTFKTGPANQLIRDHGLSPTMSTILNSLALHQALNMCFAEDTEKKNRFVLGLIITDLLGRTVGITQGIASFIVGGRVASWILTKSYDIFHLTRYGRNFNAANKSKHLAVMGSVLLAATLTPEVIALYEKQKRIKDENRINIKDYSDLLDQVSMEIVSVQKSNKSDCQKNHEIYELLQIGKDAYQGLKVRSESVDLQKKYFWLTETHLEKLNCAQ